MTGLHTPAGHVVDPNADVCNILGTLLPVLRWGNLPGEPPVNLLCSAVLQRLRMHHASLVREQIPFTPQREAPTEDLISCSEIWMLAGQDLTDAHQH